MTFSFEIIALFFIALIVFIFAVFIYLKNKRSIINRSFSIFLFGLTVIIFGFIFLSLHYPFMLFDRAIHYGGLILLFGLLIFSQVFPSGKSFPRRNWLLYIPFILVGIAIPCNLIIKSASFDSNGNVVPINGPLFLPYILFWAIYVFISFFFLFRTYQKAQNNEKAQMQYLFLGLVMLLASFLIFNLLLPLFGITYLYFVSAIASITMIWLTAHAIVRHQLLDIRIIIQRGLIYFALLGIIAIIYISGAQVLGYLLNKAANLSAILSAGITMVLGIFFFRPLEEYFQKITDKIFFKDKYNYSDALHRLSKILNTNLSQAHIINASSQALKEIFRTAKAGFHLSGTSSQTSLMAKDDRSISTSIFFEGQSIGTIVLGPKLSGGSYDSRDIQLMETFAHQAAVAIEKGRLYEKVEEYSAHLEQLVENRTLEIKNLQEEQKRIMIDISHNLQTPLTIIKGELDFLSDMPTCRDKVSTVKKSLDRVSWFIRQFLYLAKLEHSGDPNDFKLINLSALVHELAEYFEVMASEAGMRFRCAAVDGIFVIGNKRLLEEMLSNLVSNAIKYRKANFESAITVSLEDKGSNAELLIADNGIGIPQKDLPRIFTRFYRSSNAMEASQGVGLGLAIVKKIIEKHQGDISVSSILGEGAEFRIIFPKASR